MGKRKNWGKIRRKGREIRTTRQGEDKVKREEIQRIDPGQVILREITCFILNFQPNSSYASFFSFD